MPINSNVNYQQVLSMALEERSSSWIDLVSDSIPFFDVLRRKGLWQPYSGPRIRQTLLISLPDIQWYGDYDFLENPPEERFNDAYFTPKMCAVPISLSMQEILNNSGSNQLLDVLDAYMEVAEKGLAQGLDAALYGDGTGAGGKIIGGLGVALPIVATSGIYGGVDRATVPIWQPASFNYTTDFPTIGNVVNSTTVRSIFNAVYNDTVRGTDYPDLLLTSHQHWDAFDASLVAHQRITNTDGVGRLGFTSMRYLGFMGGKGVEIVHMGGMGSNFPDNTTFGINTDTFRLRYNPDRNFDKLFPGDGQRPINQDAIAQFIGWMGELTNVDPRTSFRLHGGS